MKKTLTLISVVFLFITHLQAQVPSQWDTAKTELTAKLNLVNSAIQSKWNGQQYCTNFAGNLLLANSNRGYKLFSQTPPGLPVPAYQNYLFSKIDTMLMAFDTLGFKAVDVTIQYPLLVNTFPNQQHYLNFYKTVVQKIKQRGFKVTIGCQAAFVDSTFGEPYMVQDILVHYFNPDSNSLTNDTLENNRFRQEKLQMMRTIIDSLAPDYLIMEMEPQTQQINLFNLVDYSVDSTIVNINYFTSNLSASTTLIGAGAGTWDDMDFFKEIALTNIDFIDYHVYPPHFSYINNNAFLIDSIADANNKKIIIGEAWCYKATVSEMGNITDPVGTSSMIYSRDVFDYWESVDTLFVKAMIKLSQQSKIDIVSFFWSTTMFGQITYNSATHGTMSNAQILNSGQQAGYNNMYQFILSPIGSYTQSEIAKICSANPGVKEINNTDNSIFIFPNPADETILFSEMLNDIKVFNIVGQLVMPTIKSAKSISVRELGDGIYFIHSNNAYAKFVVKH